ncbi:hypothetical protein MKW98_000402 [Papaver atlanticum]|uniref:COBRA C-terminal domain-containing protein n=1 Tax=Papaver atlanticum TaxID=357466 RepID=A0AAD4S3L0_9MAGN|nr:hypothetical protein MKW98_000402 [Papaver atlanticum]
MARVTIQNYYQYRHVEKPGWALGWSWAKGETIWSMVGAFATQQGNCSAFKNQMIPHSCKKNPIIADLMEDARAEKRSENCCHGGLLSAWAIDSSKSLSIFEIVVGNLEGNSSGHMPRNLTLMAPGPGYTCGAFGDTDPTVYLDNDGRREMQVFRTWKATCTNSSFIANKAPVCCVSLSSFYNPTITPCPLCSCTCRLAADNGAGSCIGHGFSSSDRESNNNLLQCTDHMCPIRVHWHIMMNYDGYWRVKLTITNYNFGTNYNSEIPQAKLNQEGYVTTEILLGKDVNSFTLRNGWAFPRKVSFNGENCVMPLPDDFPILPSGSFIWKPNTYHLLLLFTVLYGSS